MKLSGHELDAIDLSALENEYIKADKEKKDDTFLGRFFIAAMNQKSMVTNQIFHSGNRLAGYSIEYNNKGLKGIKDYYKLLRQKEAAHHE